MLAAPALAEAATRGFATANVNMRSGPSTAYPAVVVIPNGAPLTVHGCLSDTPWCDVSFVGGRGWVAGRYIATTYRQNRVYVEPRYYRDLGVPVITFEVGRYWDRYYRDRDFYRERDRWRRPPPSGGYWNAAPPPPRADWDRPVRVTSGVTPARVVARMTGAGNVVTATGTRVTEIRTGRVATTTVAASKMKTATAIAMASRTRMKASVAQSVASGMTRAVHLLRKISAMAAGSAIRVVTRAKQTKPGMIVGLFHLWLQFRFASRYFAAAALRARALGFAGASASGAASAAAALGAAFLRVAGFVASDVFSSENSCLACSQWCASRPWGGLPFPRVYMPVY